MFRLIGVIVGAAIAVGVLLTLFGVPEFEPGQPAAESAVITLPLGSRGTAPTDDYTAEPGADAERPDGGVTDSNAVRPAMPAVDEPQQGADDAVPAPARARADSVDDHTPLPAADASPPMHWYSFWSPFKSEIAATGFVTQLQRVTGLDYRIVRIEAGVYEVAFAYSDDDELAASLSQISAATGLEMPGG